MKTLEQVHQLNFCTEIVNLHNMNIISNTVDKYILAREKKILLGKDYQQSKLNYIYIYYIIFIFLEFYFIRFCIKSLVYCA